MQGGFSDMNNCANYGNIKGDSFGGGIVGVIDDSVSNIKHCTNYGEIDVDIWTGGIAGVSYAKTLDFYDCKKNTRTPKNFKSGRTVLKLL